MLILILFICLVINFCGIQGNSNKSLIYVGVYEHEDCFVQPNYTFPSGNSVFLIVMDKVNKIRIENATMKVNNPKENGKESSQTFNVTQTTKIAVEFPGANVNKSYNLHFIFVYKPTMNYPRGKQCSTTVFFAPSAVPTCEAQSFHLPENWTIPLAGVGVAAGMLIIVLIITTTYYRTKVKLLNRHKNLNKRTDKIEEDCDSDDRYCSNPLRKGKKGAQILNQSRESDIYEDPKVTLGVSPMPPALPTSPRPDRTGTALKIPPSPSSTLQSTASSQRTFPRKNPIDKDTLPKISIANRPPLPLPQDEFYNEVQEDDTYEPPPIHELLHQTPLAKKRDIPEKIVKPIPDKIVRPRPEKAEKPTQAKLGKKLHIPMDALKPPGMNIPPKTHGIPTPQQNNEGISTLQRNKVHIPIRQIPDTSSLKRAPPVKPKPPVALPKTNPVPYIEPEEYNNDRHDSTDDEEWTYEPLPSFNIYSS